MATLYVGQKSRFMLMTVYAKTFRLIEALIEPAALLPAERSAVPSPHSG
jgi:hypothetical protein